MKQIDVDDKNGIIIERQTFDQDMTMSGFDEGPEWNASLELKNF